MADFQEVLAMGKSGHQSDRQAFMARQTAERFISIYQELV
jgi:hypothetical protein